jgi:transposase-like protein
VATDGRGARPASAETALEALDAELTRHAVEGLERIMAQQAAAICAASGAKRNGTDRRRVRYRGQVLEVRVPRLVLQDKQHVVVPLYEELKLSSPDVSKYIDEGVSMRGVGRLLGEVTPGGVPRGTSSSSVQRSDVAAAREQLRAVNNQMLDDEGIVAVMLDGTELDGWTVLVATVVTVDGRKLVARVEQDRSENHELVGRLLDGLVSHGVDRRVLKIVDGGRALWKGARELPLVLCARGVKEGLPQETHAELVDKRLYEAWRQDDEQTALTRLHELADELQGRGYASAADSLRSGAEQRHVDLQSCLVHHLRKVKKGLPEHLHEVVKEQAYEAWAENDADAALNRLRGLADELRLLGYESAAASLLNGLDETVTLQRLDVDFTTRLALRNTNNLESQMGSIKRQVRDVTLWNEGEMRLLWTARALRKMERRWSRVADPPGLVALQRRLMPDQYDSAKLLWRLPPTLRVQDLRVTAPGAAETITAPGMSAATPQGQWLGSQGALKLLGIDRSEAVTTEKLALALQGRHVGTGALVRQASTTVLEWRLEASAEMSDLWSRSDEPRRREIEQALISSAESALARLTGSDKPLQVGAAGTLWVAKGAGLHGGSLIGVAGVTFGVLRGRRKLVSPATNVAKEPAVRRRAADAARVSLNAALTPPTVEQEQAPSREPAALPSSMVPDSLYEYRRYLLGGRRNKIEADVAHLEPRVRARSDEWLLARRRWLGDPFGQLDRSGALMTMRLERDVAIALRDLEKARVTGDNSAAAQLEEGLESLHTLEGQLRGGGRHLNSWMTRYAGPAAEVVAIERVAVRRELELDWRERAEALAIAREARSHLLEPYRGLLGDRRIQQLATSAEWPAAWLLDRDDKWVATRLAEMAEPLTDLKRELQLRTSDRRAHDAPRHERPGARGEARAHDLDDLMHQYGPPAVQWLALRGQAAVLERAQATPERGDPHERRRAPKELHGGPKRARPEPAAPDVEVFAPEL